MRTEKYNLSFTAGGLFYLEALRIAELYLRERSWDLVRKEVIDRNLLQSRTTASSRRICAEICGRLECLSDDELKMLVEENQQEQRYILWLAICRRHSFLYEFSVEIVREKYLQLDFSCY